MTARQNGCIPEDSTRPAPHSLGAPRHHRRLQQGHKAREFGSPGCGQRSANRHSQELTKNSPEETDPEREKVPLPSQQQILGEDSEVLLDAHNNPAMKRGLLRRDIEGGFGVYFTPDLVCAPKAIPGVKRRWGRSLNRTPL